MSGGVPAEDIARAQGAWCVGGAARGLDVGVE